MQTENMKSSLETLQKELSHRITAIKNDFQNGRSADSSEQAIEHENEEVLQQLKSDAEAELYQVNAALNKIKTGEYGECEKCQEPIDETRLNVIPFATHCISCA